MMTLFVIFQYAFYFITIAGLLLITGRYTFWLPSKNQTYPRIIMFHQIDPSLPASGMNTPPAKFEQWLQLLVKQHYTFCTVSELCQNECSTQKRVAITFDDGFSDNYLHAFPLLKKYNAKATIYLATSISGINVLTESQINEMSASGLIEFGAHSLSHINLTTLDDLEAMDQIEGSRNEVLRLTGHCESFAYPFGRYLNKHMAMVEQAGFKSAVSTRKRIEAINNSNRFQLPRISSNGAMNILQMRIALAKGRYRL